MGITGLLPMMKAASVEMKLDKLKGTVAAVDTNGWIHRACYNCGDKVYMNEPTEVYINYCVNYCKVLRKHEVTPILVFDGQSLPAKAQTKLLRQKRKQAVRETIEELLRTGNQAKARYLMRTCVDVTFELVRNVIVRCRAEGIDCLVAPFEADAQICYLVNSGLADFAITEDSDMLVFGCRQTLYKLDRDTAKGRMVYLDRMGKCFKGFEQRRFQFMCILSGCDYLFNLPNVGMGRARKFFETTKTSFVGTESEVSEEFIRTTLLRVPNLLNMTGKVKVTDDYIEGFVRALRTFDHQLIYCPITERITHLRPLSGGMRKHRELCLGQYAGEFFPNNDCPGNSSLNLVTNYILGNVHTKTLELVDQYNPFEGTISECPMEEEEQENGSTPPKYLSPRDSIWFSELIIERIQAKRLHKNPENKSEEEEEEPDSIPESPIKKLPKKKSKSWKRNLDSDQESPIKEVKESPIKKISSISSARLKLSMKKLKIEDVDKTKKQDGRHSRGTTVDEDEKTDQDLKKMSINSIKSKLNRKLNQENNVPNLELEQSEDKEKETTLIRVTRSRNIFRKVDSNTTATGLVTKSKYFIDQEDDDEDEKKVPEVEVARKTVHLIESDTSDFETEFADFITKKSSQQPAICDLDTSVISNIDDEDRVILCGLNSSQSSTRSLSSGFCSQISSSSSSTITINNAFTKLKQSPSSTKKITTTNNNNGRKSKNSRNSNSNDIRNFFTTTID